MANRKLGLLLGTLSLALRLAADGPETGTSAPASEFFQTTEEATRKIRSRPEATDRSNTSQASVSQDNVVLEASKEKVSVSARATLWEWGTTDHRQLELAAKGPIKETAESAPLADKDGLTNGVTAELALTGLRWRPKIDLATQNALFVAYAKSLSVAQKEEVGGSALAVGSVWDWSALVKLLRKRACAAGEPLCSRQQAVRAFLGTEILAAIDGYDDAAPWAKKDKEALIEKLNTGLDAESFTDALGGTIAGDAAGPVGTVLLARHRDRLPLTQAERRHLNRLILEAAFAGADVLEPAGYPEAHSDVKDPVFKARLREATDFGTPVLWSLRAQAGREDFEYAAPETLEVKDASRYSYSVAVAIGVLTKANYFVAASARVGSTHKAAGDAIDICTPIGASGALGCRNLVVGPPKREDLRSMQVEIRHFLRKSVAINPKVVYDFKKETFGVEVPLYFLSGPGGLIGGVIYRAEEGKSWSASLLVGKAFGLVGGV